MIRILVKYLVETGTTYSIEQHKYCKYLNFDNMLISLKLPMSLLNAVHSVQTNET
jgi:hypothetical protein